MSSSTVAPAIALRATPLGGVGHFGRNCLLLELMHDGVAGPAILVDCGVRFIADEAPGFDVGLPDLERIAALGDRLLGYVITHGHEDHIGGLPYACAENARPIYATAFTLGLIARRFERLSRDMPAVHLVRTGETHTLGPFAVTFTAVSHSIPDATALVINTPVGRVVCSGDFRIDADPVLGPPTDMATLEQAGDAGVLALFADSTGALSDGDNPGERSVWPQLLDAVEQAPARVFIALFASHLQRIVLCADAARATGRKMLVKGKGLHETIALGRRLSLLQIDDVVVDDTQLRTLPRHRQLVLLTGTQGEEHAALARLSRDDPSAEPFAPDDTVILSARVIPGNERRAHALLDALAERGAHVIDGYNAPHVSGHGHRGDLENLLMAVRPQIFVALHGNARHLLAHGDLARDAGLTDDTVIGLRDGRSVVLHGGGRVVVQDGEPAQEPFAIDGHVEHFPRGVVATRQRMAHQGVLVVTGTAAAPTLIPRGIPDALFRALVPRLDAAARLALAPGQDEAAAVRSVVKVFLRARLAPPEVVIVPAVDA